MSYTYNHQNEALNDQLSVCLSTDAALGKTKMTSQALWRLSFFKENLQVVVPLDHPQSNGEPWLKWIFEAAFGDNNEHGWLSLSDI